MTGTLVGPLPVIRFADGSRRAYTPPRDTCDNRYAACTDHHPACDCREALLNEDITEWRTMYRQLEKTVLTAIKGHQTYALECAGEFAWSSDDEFGQCKCSACAIARTARIGFTQCMQQRREATGQLEAAARERERAYYARTFTYSVEPPF